MVTGQEKKDINNLISDARFASHFIRTRLWSRNEIKLNNKIWFYLTVIRTILLYGCESWPMKTKHLQKFVIFDFKWLRHILRSDYQQFISNATIQSRCWLKSSWQTPPAIQLRSFSHTLCQQQDNLIYVIINPCPLQDWKKNHEGQLKSWLITEKCLWSLTHTEFDTKTISTTALDLPLFRTRSVS